MRRIRMVMQKILMRVTIVISLLASSFSNATEPRNLDLIKQSLIRYHNSGEYEKDIARVVKQAQAYLEFRLDKNQARHLKQKLAIILDIDETALSNYSDLMKLGFGGS